MVLLTSGRYHAVGIHVSKGPRMAKTQSNGRINLSVHLRIHCFDPYLALFGTVLTLFGPYLALFGLKNCIWDPEID